MISYIAIESFARAEECRLEARKTLNTKERAAWLELADEWLRLAQGTANDEALEPPGSPEREEAFETYSSPAAEEEFPLFE